MRNVGLDLTKNGNGFLANVAEANSTVVDINMTSAPSTDSKPLGFYFSKDIPGHVREKSLGTKDPSSTSPGGKAAMGLYFSKDTTVSDDSGSDVTTQAKPEDASSHDSRQGRSTSDTQQSADTIAGQMFDANAHESKAANHTHRKYLRGSSMGVQGLQGDSTRAVQKQEVNQQAQASSTGAWQKARDKSQSSLVIAVNSSEGQFKPAAKKSSLNTDDM